LRGKKTESGDKERNRKKKQSGKDYFKKQELRNDELIDEFDYGKKCEEW
jgi:hypothetical protein